MAFPVMHDFLATASGHNSHVWIIGTREDKTPTSHYHHRWRIIFHLRSSTMFLSSHMLVMLATRTIVDLRAKPRARGSSGVIHTFARPLRRTKDKFFGVSSPPQTLNYIHRNIARRQPSYRTYTNISGRFSSAICQSLNGCIQAWPQSVAAPTLWR